jgi:hypothetical protein
VVDVDDPAVRPTASVVIRLDRVTPSLYDLYIVKI